MIDVVFVCSLGVRPPECVGHLRGVSFCLKMRGVLFSLELRVVYSDTRNKTPRIFPIGT